MAVKNIERMAKENKKHDLRRLYALEVKYPHKTDFSLINHIEFGFIHDAIVNQALLHIFDRKDIHPEYYYSQDQILNMSAKERATLLNTSEFSNKEQLEKYCLENYVDIISTYTIEV